MTEPKPHAQPIADHARPTASGGDFDLFSASQGAKILQRLAITSILILLLVSAWHYWRFQQITNEAMFPNLLSITLVLVLIRRKLYRIALNTFLWTMVVTATYAAINVNGLYSPILIVMPLLALIGAQMLSRRAAKWFFFAICLALGVILLMQLDGRFNQSVSRDPQFMFLVIIGISGLGFLLGSGSARGLREQFTQAAALGQQLAELNAQLEHKVEHRTAELSSALERLQRTQDDLIHAEKLASLGSMVAGISHELNTPIGNAVTVASSLSDRAKNLQEAFEQNTLKRSELVNGLVAVHEMAQLIERSANRAAALVSSFKQVAIDQVSERRRTFDLREVIEENLTTLRVGIKHKPWIIDNQVAAGITCDSFPGPLGQIFTNLIQNAILHGFADREQGRIEISADTASGLLELTVADDGVGMDTATAVRIFEPFFTTRLGKGGSGLGLAICHRIATTILAGELRVISASGTGTRFTLRIPLRTPGTV